MKIDIITLCEYAKIDNGQLTIIDTIDSFTFPRFPWRAYFGIAVKGSLDKNMPRGNYTLSIFNENDIEAADSKTLSDSRYLFKTQTPSIEVKGKFAMAGNIRGLIFNSPGSYIFRVETNDGLTHDYSFKVEGNE